MFSPSGWLCTGAYITINMFICAAAPSYNSSLYLTIATLTGSITNSTAQDDILEKLHQPVK